METKAGSHDRYHKQTILPGFGDAAQDRLKQASVLLVGAGGLGSPAALYLAAAGIGRLTIVDPDRVELSNLQRQVLYQEKDAGAPKHAAARAALLELNSTITIDARPLRFDRDTALALGRGQSVILDASDNLTTRDLSNRVSLHFAIPLVVAGLYQFEGQIAVFSGHGSPCYRCAFPVLPMTADCNQSGVLGALAGLIGSYQALEVIRCLTGFGKPSAGTLLKLDALTNRWTRITIAAEPQCRACQKPMTDDLMTDFLMKGDPMKPEQDLQISPSELAARIKAGDPLTLLDVREPDERKISSLGGLFIPLGDLSSRLSELDPQQEIVVYCHHGVRSLQAVGMLRAAGYPRARSLAGGTDRWSLQIDPELPRY